MIPLIVDNQATIAALCQRYGVVRLELFGSAARGAFDMATSDLDFLVTYPDDYDFDPWLGRHFDLRDDLAHTLGRRVDLVMSDALRHRWFRDEIAATGEVLYDERAAAAGYPALAG